MARDQLKIPVQIMKLHKVVFLTCNFLCEKDSIIYDVGLEYIFNGCQSPCESNGPGNFPGLQGGVSILPILLFTNHNGS